MIEGTKKEKTLTIITIILSTIIVFGAMYFVSEIKYLKENCGEKPVDLSAIREFKLENLSDSKDETTMGDILDSEEAKLVYFARPTCSHCVAQTPIMQELATKYKADIYYMNIDNLSDVDYKQLVLIDEDFFKSFGTPTIAIFEKGAIVDSIEGETESSNVLSIMKKYSIVK